MAIKKHRRRFSLGAAMDELAAECRDQIVEIASRKTKRQSHQP